MRTVKVFAIAALALPAAAMASQMERDDLRMQPVDDRRSIGLMADVGVNDYNRQLAGDVNTGVGYGLIADLSPQRNIGLEIGYRGGVNNLDDAISPDGRLITNQVGGNLRVNVVPPEQQLPANLKPFVFGGAFYHRVDTQNFTPGFEGQNAFALPVGLGLEADITDRFIVGGRFTYNFLFNEDGGFDGRSADNWLATVSLGTRFGL